MIMLISFMTLFGYYIPQKTYYYVAKHFSDAFMAYSKNSPNEFRHIFRQNQDNNENGY